MSLKSGRVYHPAPESAGGIGLVKSSLAIEFSSLFNFDKGEEYGPTQFNWQGIEYEIDSKWYKKRMSDEEYRI